MAVFSAASRKLILQLVRDTIESYLAGVNPPSIDPAAEPALQRPGACFVTLHTDDGSLRGCIGSLIATEPLIDNLRRHALNAALNDPRFPPVAADEMAEIAVEVSVLTEPQVIARPEDFRVGVDGIILKCAGRSSVFLPQVATEQGWDRETTFGYLAQKAGLPADAWRRPDAELSTFQAEVFGEV